MTLERRLTDALAGSSLAAQLRTSAAPFLERHGLSTPGQIRDAAIRFVLTNPEVHSVAISFKNFDDVEA